MRRPTIASLSLTIQDLREEIAEENVRTERAEFERDDWQRTAGELRTLLERSDAEVDFLRSVVHGLVPASLRPPAPVLDDEEPF